MIKPMRFALALLLTFMVVMVASQTPGHTDSTPLSIAGLSGSAAMQTVTLGARAVRIEMVPGSGGREGWAVGHMKAARPGWHSDTLQGQLVFLHSFDLWPFAV
ncbi:MAG: hypothetical protein LC723_11690 [Actinobacteria bacterium]|nr:hypothetical protein [Actinomycetota bacterium]